jgi:hypothetical protein
MPDIKSAIASTYVEPRGSIRAVVAKVAGGQALGAAGAAIAGTATRSEGSPVKAGGIGFLAVFADEVVVVRGKRGALKPKPTEEVIARAPRSSLSSAELDRKAVKGTLTLSFADGEKWEFDMPRVHLKAAEKVARALT